jgi:hypothetical protein
MYKNVCIVTLCDIAACGCVKDILEADVSLPMTRRAGGRDFKSVRRAGLRSAGLPLKRPVIHSIARTVFHVRRYSSDLKGSHGRQQKKRMDVPKIKASRIVGKSIELEV